MNLYEFIGREVRNHRKALELTQADLAAAARVTRSTIANLETGRQQVPVEQLVAIGRALSVDYRELLPAPAVIAVSSQGPVTAETVSQRAPATASLIRRLQQESLRYDSNAEA